MSTALQPYESPDFSLADHDLSSEKAFPFMSLPIEIRLKIYALLLPPRTHTIVTQIPHNGYFYNTASIPAFSTQSFYPFGRTPPQNLTTYKVLTTNFRVSFPAASIHPEILRVSKQIREEAEPVLYGGKDVQWDFGIHLDALKAFWRDRSVLARESVRNIRIAREIPAEDNRDGGVGRPVDVKWIEFCSFIKSHLPSLRNLDLTIWSSSGATTSFPSSGPAPINDEAHVDREQEARLKVEQARRWREWEWTCDLLQLEELRKAKINWWGFQSVGEGTEISFDHWLAGRMVGDKIIRDRMIKEGVVVEGFVVLPGREV